MSVTSELGRKTYRRDTDTSSVHSQLPLWKERLQLTGVIALKIDELRAHASRGVACVRLMPMASADATPEQKSSGERSFSSLVGSLSSKNVVSLAPVSTREREDGGDSVLT